MTDMYEYFNSVSDFFKPIEFFKEEHFNTFSFKMNLECTRRKFEITRIYNMRNGEEVPLFYLKLDVCLLAGIFGKLTKISFEEDQFEPLCFVSAQLTLANVL